MPTPEQQARDQIDQMLDAAGWAVQDAAKANIHASRGVALRNFALKAGHGFADYLLYVDGSAAGVVEAKKQGTTLTGVEIQSAKYSEGLPQHLPARIRPLPFCYESTGVETQFTNGLDPQPRSRQVFWFHRPETVAGWVDDLAQLQPLPGQWSETPLYKGTSTVRGKVRHLPPLVTGGLWSAQIKAIQNLERSLADDRPRALIQMATGSGKTYTAISFIYRLIKFAEARRVCSSWWTGATLATRRSRSSSSTYRRTSTSSSPRSTSSSGSVRTRWIPPPGFASRRDRRRPACRSGAVRIHRRGSEWEVPRIARGLN
jgi:type I restriction enzyme, R subunit